MKRSFLLVLAILVAGGVVFAQDADPITEATVHAREDAGSYEGTGWGSLAFGASVLLSPLFGGGGVIVAANLVEPRADIPTSRLARAQEQFPEASDLFLYKSQYREEMVEPMQKQRSRRAWIGTGIGFGLNVFLIVALLGA